MIWNREAETLRPGARAALQLERSRQSVAWAAERVPFHQARLGRARPDRLAQLAELPFTRKSDLREHYPFGLFAVPTPELARLHASSGTKGKPTVVGYTASDLDVWREVMARVMVAAGARAGDMLHVAYGYGLFTGGLGFHDGAERIGMTVVPVSSGNTARIRSWPRSAAGWPIACARSPGSASSSRSSPPTRSRARRARRFASSKGRDGAVS